MEATADALAMPVARCWKGVSAVSCEEEVGVRRGELREGPNKLANGAVSTNPRTLPARRAARNAMDCGWVMSWLEWKPRGGSPSLVGAWQIRCSTPVARINNDMNAIGPAW